MPEDVQENEAAVDETNSGMAPSKWKKAATKAMLINALTKSKGTNKQVRERHPHVLLFT